MKFLDILKFHQITGFKLKFSCLKLTKINRINLNDSINSKTLYLLSRNYQIEKLVDLFTRRCCVNWRISAANEKY